jgi:hypothetical protein
MNEGCYSSGEIKKKIWNIVKLEVDSKVPQRELSRVA